MIEGIVNQVTDASNEAAAYMANRLWEKYDEDEVTERRIVNDLYEAMYQELETYGVSFTCELSDLFENDVKALRVTRVMRELRDRNLVTFVRGHKEMVPLIQDLIETKPEQDRALMVLEYINGILQDEDLTETIAFVSDKISTDTEFVRYLKLVIDYGDKTRAELNDVETAGTVISMLSARREFIAGRVSALKGHSNVLDLVKISKLGERFGHWLLRPENLNLTCAYFRATDTLRDSEIFKKFIRAFLDNSPFYLGYYRPDTISPWDSDTITDTEAAMIFIGQKVFVFDTERARDFETVVNAIQTHLKYVPSPAMEEVVAIINQGELENA